MVLAGRLCLRFFANDDAQALARRGLQFAEKLSDAERVCLSVELHDVLLAAAPLADWQAAAAEYVELAEQALDHGALAHARLGYHMASHVRWAHGHWVDAREETLQAERVTRGGSDEEHIIGMAEAARCLAMIERDLTQADAMLMEAQALAVRKGIRHPSIPMALGMLRFHEGRLDEAEELLKDARTQCKSAGDRLGEFQANEYLVMLDIERGRFESAGRRCHTLVELGERLREGSEAPFARALEALCRYGAHDQDCAALEKALDELRMVDAQHRLAYTLTRAALLDMERGHVGSALLRAGEALDHAEVLERATEMMLANMVLARAHEANGDRAAHERHLLAVDGLCGEAVAQWARERARPLLGRA
jgi:tetratricopeptide (TPR) repeat protein